MKTKLTRLSSVSALVLSGLLACTSFAVAQSSTDSSATPRRGGKRVEIRDRLQQVSKELNLTDDQKEKLKPILRAEAQKIQRLRQDSSLSQQEKRKKIQEMRQEVVAKVKPILTAEQWEKWQNLRKQRRASQETAK